MFLLNSPMDLVTATCPSLSRHHIYLRYVANLPSSLGWIISNTFAFSARGTCFPIMEKKLFYVDDIRRQQKNLFRQKFLLLKLLKHIVHIYKICRSYAQLVLRMLR